MVPDLSYRCLFLFFFSLKGWGWGRRGGGRVLVFISGLVLLSCSRFEKHSFPIEKTSFSRGKAMYFNRFNRNTRFVNGMTKFINRNTKFFNQNSRFFKNMWQKASTYTHFGSSILIIHSLKTVLGKSLCYLHNLFEELQSHCVKSVRILCFSGAYLSRIWN